MSFSLFFKEVCLFTWQRWLLGVWRAGRSLRPAGAFAAAGGLFVKVLASLGGVGSRCTGSAAAAHSMWDLSSPRPGIELRVPCWKVTTGKS